MDGHCPCSTSWQCRQLHRAEITFQEPSPFGWPKGLDRTAKCLRRLVYGAYSKLSRRVVQRLDEVYLCDGEGAACTRLGRQRTVTIDPPFPLCLFPQLFPCYQPPSK